MFDFFLCCNHGYLYGLSSEKNEEVQIESDLKEDYQESYSKETFQNSINDLKKAEKEALEIVEMAKKNRREYLRQAENAAKEIIKPYYDLADQEFKEIETQLNKDLHIMSLENILNIQENPDHIEEASLQKRKKKAVEYIYSKISQVKFELENPKFVRSQLEKHRISNNHHKKYRIRSRLMSLRSKDHTEKKQETNKPKNTSKTKKEKAISFVIEENDSSMSTIELDEDYSRIDNLYGASRVVNSFNTIHLN